jgi:ribonucleoside-diphosphate reductase beta chain
VLEGILFTAGQLAMLELLEEAGTLPGVSDGLALVMRDERWHIGFGARALGLIGATETIDDLLAAAAPAAAAWGDAVAPRLRTRVL